MTWFSYKVQKPCFCVIFDHFWSFLPDRDFLQKIQLSHTSIYGPLTACWVSQKTNEPIPRKLWTDGRTHGRMDGRMDTPYFIGPTILKNWAIWIFIKCSNFQIKTCILHYQKSIKVLILLLLTYISSLSCNRSQMEKHESQLQVHNTRSKADVYLALKEISGK